MQRCPLTYKLLSADESGYSLQGIKKISRVLSSLHSLSYTLDELEEACCENIDSSLAGIQPKVSARLNLAKESFDVVNKNGDYIFKIPHPLWPEIVENEDLTMRLAQLMGIQVPLHGMLYDQEGHRIYFIRRFDRLNVSKKIATEDFAQLLGKARESKYHSSMEIIAQIIDTYCTFPMVEKEKFFRLTLFSILVGNNDLHLKNISLMQRHGIVQLTPAYDLVNMTIMNSEDQNELALTLNKQRQKFTYEDLIDYFGHECLGLPKKLLKKIIHSFITLLPDLMDFIDTSFLSKPLKKQYKELIYKRLQIIELQK